MTNTTPLLIPMKLNALLVNADVAKNVDRQFERWQSDYAQLNSYANPVPDPFSSVNDPPGLGVHLHWTLPAAFKRGERINGRIAFPMIPNRWLVTRLATRPGGAPELAAWIVESDYLGADGTSPFADPANSRPGAVRTTKIGRHCTLDAWAGEKGGTLFLGATGLGDVAFTAYQPGLLDVLAFHDEGVTGLPDGTAVTYGVCGWYSDPAHDPLAGATPAELGWTVAGAAAGPFDTSVLHGLTVALSWASSGMPAVIDGDPTKLKLAVGYNSVDALAALLDDAQAGSDSEMALQAFQHGVIDTLDDPDGRAQIESRIRQGWFGATAGGVLWKIVPVAQGQASALPLDAAHQPSPPPLTAAQAAWLAALNVAQRGRDVAERTLTTLQTELYGLWWKSQYGAVVAQDPVRLSTQADAYGLDLKAMLGLIEQAIDPADPDGVMRAVTTLQAQIASAASALPDPADPADVEAFSRTIPGNPATGEMPLVLRATTLAPFNHPADPVVLIEGLTLSDGEPRGGATLACRTLDATVDAVVADASTISVASGTLRSVIPLPATSAFTAPVAAAIGRLAIEAYFRHPANAAAIVQLGLGRSDAGLVADLQAGIAAGTAQVSVPPPDPSTAFARAPWSQAWLPLFLEWDLEWLPTVGTERCGTAQSPGAIPSGSGHAPLTDTWPFDAGAWTFDGSDGVAQRGGEYDGWTGEDRWAGSAPATPTSSFTGRSFLTPQAMDLFLDRLRGYAGLHPKDEEIADVEALIDRLGATSFLSQTLGGFNAWCVMQDFSHKPPPPPGALADAIGDGHRASPAVARGDQRLQHDQGTPFFFPVRGGFFRFTSLQLVDAYGQVMNLLCANGNQGGLKEAFEPIRGAGLCVAATSSLQGTGQLMLQAPRIVQPARVNLRFLDSDMDAKELDYDATAQPLCGWLLPNHLDRSIAAYDAAGTALGELILLAGGGTAGDGDGGRIVTWLPAPAAEPPVIDPATIGNAHLADLLSDFVKEGVPGGMRADAFEAFYRAIDETLWTVDPPGGHSDHDLAVLIGRPIAVVRAAVGLELFGRPAVNQSWRDSWDPAAPGLLQDADATKLCFPVKLGSVELLDDGLIGYFKADDYTAFNAVHPSAGAGSRYVQPIVPGNYLLLPIDYPHFTPTMLTLLVDPRGKIHATSGILPTAAFEVPAELYTAALARMAVTFRAGPVLTDTAAMRLPMPPGHDGSWDWIGRTGHAGTAADWTSEPIVAANAGARLDDAPPRLVEGWLRITPKASL